MLFLLSILGSCRRFQVFNHKTKPIAEVPHLFDENPLTLPDLNTLIKVPYYQLGDRTGNWSEDHNNKSIHSIDPSSAITFTFNGTKFFVVADKGPDKCTIKIKIDDIFENSTVDLYATNNFTNEVVFISPNLTFGEHTLQIFYDQPHDSANVINIAYIYYRPYYNEERLQYKLVDRLEDLPPSFSGSQDELYEAITCKTDGSFTIDFYGTRFWLTGQITNSIEITIDNVQAQPISSNDSHQELGVLIYYSDILGLDNHTIQLRLVNSTLISFLFCQQPYNAVNIPTGEIIPYSRGEISGYYLETTEFYHETNLDGNTFNFFFYGTSFWAIGHTIPSNDQTQLWNATSFIHTFDTIGGDALFNYSLPLDNHVLYIKHQPNPPGIDKILRLYNIFYIIENDIQSTPSNSILFYETDYDSNWKIYQTKDNHGSHLYSTTQHATLTIKFVGWKFWLEGFLNPNNGRIEISINGTQKATFRLYREKPEKAVVYYESPDLPLGEHTITLKALDNSPITFSRLFYSFHEDLQSRPPNGLIRVPARNINISGLWNLTNDEIYSPFPQAEAHYTFYGTKVYLYSARNDGVRSMEVYIDDNFAAIVDLYVETGNTGIISFTSNDLPFGKHTVTVKHPGTHSKAISLKGILYRPHLLHSNTVISAADMTLSNDWTPNSDTSPSYVETTTNGATLQFNFSGTRFWLTGNAYASSSTCGEFNITIDNKNTYGPFSPLYKYQDENSYLLYSSDVLELQDHTIKITVTSSYPNKVAICDLFYSQQPKDSSIIYPKDMLKTNYAIQSRSELTTELYYSIQDLNDYFQFRYLGTSFWFFGVLNSESGFYNILDGNSYVVSKSSAYLPYPFEVCYSLLTTSTLDYCNHVIQIESNQSDKSLSMHYVFYSSKIDEPFEPFFTMNSKNFSYNTDWQIITDDTSDNSFIESTIMGSTATIKYGGGNFTLEGYLGPCNGMVHIYIDHEYTSNVSLHREEYGYSLFYRSPEDLRPAVHEIEVVNRNGNPVRLSKIYYMPSPTMYFTNSNMFTPSSDFTKTESFTETTGFTHSEHFSKSNAFADSFEFTPSESFTKSIRFSESGYFTFSEEFTSNALSYTKSFSESNSFSKSLSFSSSTQFTKSQTLKINEQTPAENQSQPKSNKTMTIVISVVVSLVVIGIIIVLFLIFYIRRKNNNTIEHENSFEADSSNVAMTFIPATNAENDDELNSYALDVFDDQSMNYEEDQKD